MNQQFLTELKAVTAENRIFTDEPMKKHTTFRVGGPADILVQPKGTELASVIRLCRKYDVPYQVCLLYTSPSPRDRQRSRMPSSA